MNRYRLENDHVSVDFDQTTGALTRLLFKDTSWCVQRRPELSHSFGLLVPVPGKRNTRILGRRQLLANAEYDAEAPSLRLTWDKRLSETGILLDIRFTGMIALRDNRLELTAILENRTEYTIEACTWPWLGDLSRPAGTTHFYHLHQTYGTAVNESLYPTFESHRGCFGVEHPVQLSATPSSPFVLAHNGSQGLYSDITTRARSTSSNFALNCFRDSSLQRRLKRARCRRVARLAVRRYISSVPLFTFPSRVPAQRN